jgi:hypothetical protein
MKGSLVIFCCLFFLSDKAQFQPSPDGHYLLRDGKAFFWLGFTVIQAVVLAEFDGLHTANVYGDLPLKEGLVIGLLPTWGDKVTKSWGVGPVIFNPENAVIYGRWLGNRYKNSKNIIWIPGGDRNPQKKNYTVN